MGGALELRAMNGSDADLVAFRECFECNGTPRRLDVLRWQYADNPTHELVVHLAVSDERIAAIYAVQPGFVRVRGAVRLAAQSVDTLVDADFRGHGLFTKMAEAAYERVRELDGAFVYGFPNGNSAPGFFGKLRWRSLDPVPFLVRPLRTAFLASKLPLGRWLRRLPDLRVPIRGPELPASYELRPVTVLGPELDALWQRFATNVTVAVDRSAEYLRWRLTKTGEQYQCLGVFDQAQLVAFCAYTTVDKHGGRIGYVIELLHEPGAHEVGAALLVECLRRMAADGADAVLAWSFRHSPNAKAYSTGGFVTLPERLRPIELHFGVRPLDDSLSNVVGDRRNWYISYCDSDTV
ncbi:MAG: GNAT family N-acetyltransferase [Deltaproteobacteria bacterium]|nr:GNAT family N-acetyltransferase [Deltaproteobacteria bacterium]MBW2158810.1 GNAT family N-acetyltransferase [Deltaproteobacteria bacterium]